MQSSCHWGDLLRLYCTPFTALIDQFSVHFIDTFGLTLHRASIRESILWSMMIAYIQIRPLDRSHRTFVISPNQRNRQAPNSSGWFTWKCHQQVGRCLNYLYNTLMLLYTNTRNDNVVSYYYYFARGRFLASSKSRLCTFIHLFIVCGVCVLANELDRSVGWLVQSVYSKWTSPPFRLRQYLQPSQSPVDLHKGHTATNYNHHRPRPVQSVFSDLHLVATVKPSRVQLLSHP